MKNPRGSAWNKWDLHVHTPDSIVQHYGAGEDAWDKFIDALSKLPPEFKVLGINDYMFLDGYKKVLKAKNDGRLPNIDLLLPVVELRLDKFGGSKSGLSRINYHIIFSDEIKPDIIESQFLNALSSKYTLTPRFDSLRTSGKWAAIPTRRSIEDLGRLIIESVPPEESAKFNAPAVEGFNNLCVSLDTIQDILKSQYFCGKTLTAVGKTEWADIKWNDHSIAEKKTIINTADLVFISSTTAGEYASAKQTLTDGRVNDRLLDCSDAHRWANSTEKDRLGKCFTWIKADTTFEGLRQAIFEYPHRVHVSEVPPIAPVLQIKKATMVFPHNTSLDQGGDSDVFCFSGNHEIVFSPYLTCIIGGRGTGKSTLLNLLHEKLSPGSAEFFQNNKLLPTGTSIDTCVAIDGVTGKGVVEFLQQNEIEQFAANHTRLTSAIFSRLGKLDTMNVLQEKQGEIDAAVSAINKQLDRLKKHHDLSVTLDASKKELATQKEIVASFQSADFKRLNEELSALNKESQALKTGKVRLQNLIQDLQTLIADYPLHDSKNKATLNAHEQQACSLIAAIEASIEDTAKHPSLQTAKARELELSQKAKTLRSELDSFLKSRGLSEENLSDVGRATERIAQLEESIGSLNGQITVLKNELSQFAAQRDKAQEYEKAVKQLLAPINVELKGQGTEVKPIELGYRFDLKAFKDEMIDHITKAIGLIEGRAARPDYVESKLKDIDFMTLTDRDAFHKMIPNEVTVYSKRLRDFFSEEVNFETLKLIAELRLLDVRNLGHIFVLYDNKSVENTSFGQRCTAVIVILLLLGNTPIVIDEPEAHLDSSLIAKYLVQLIKSRKMHRQIIFATHNANLVINGDAELVHCMTMDDTRVTRAISTTIEDLKHRESLLALEGGHEAFHQREKRYGID